MFNSSTELKNVIFEVLFTACEAWPLRNHRPSELDPAWLFTTLPLITSDVNHRSEHGGDVIADTLPPNHTL